MNIQNKPSGAPSTATLTQAKDVAKSTQAETLARQKPVVAQATGDKTEISPRAKDFVKIEGMAKQAPEIREERVAALKKQIQDGTYKVDAETLANKLVDEHVSWAKKG